MRSAPARHPNNHLVRGWRIFGHVALLGAATRYNLCFPEACCGSSTFTPDTCCMSDVPVAKVTAGVWRAVNNVVRSTHLLAKAPDDDALDVYDFSILNAPTSTGKSRSEAIDFIVPKDPALKFANSEITNQQLIDKSSAREWSPHRSDPATCGIKLAIPTFPSVIWTFRSSSPHVS